MDGAKGFSDDYFRAGFFPFHTLLSGSLSLSLSLSRMYVTSMGTRSLFCFDRLVYYDGFDGDMNFSALAGWSPVPPTSF